MPDTAEDVITVYTLPTAPPVMLRMLSAVSVALPVTASTSLLPATGLSSTANVLLLVNTTAPPTLSVPML